MRPINLIPRSAESQIHSWGRALRAPKSNRRSRMAEERKKMSCVVKLSPRSYGTAYAGRALPRFSEEYRSTPPCSGLCIFQSSVRAIRMLQATCSGSTTWQEASGYLATAVRHCTHCTQCTVARRAIECMRAGAPTSDQPESVCVQSWESSGVKISEMFLSACLVRPGTVGDSCRLVSSNRIPNTTAVSVEQRDNASAERIERSHIASERVAGTQKRSSCVSVCLGSPSFLQTSGSML